jgi:hypothetical protein
LDKNVYIFAILKNFKRNHHEITLSGTSEQALSPSTKGSATKCNAKTPVHTQLQSNISVKRQQTEYYRKQTAVAMLIP